MPVYNYRCISCPVVLKNYFKKRFDDPGPNCPQCLTPMEQLAPSSIHTKIGSSIDSRDVGKRVKQKNEQLKKKWSGYERDEQNLRKEITKRTEEKTKESS